MYTENKLGKLVLTTKDEEYLKKHKKQKTIFYVFMGVGIVVIALWLSFIVALILGVLLILDEQKKNKQSKLVSYCEIYENGIKGVSKGRDTYNHSFSLLYDEIKYVSSTTDEFTIVTNHLSYEVWASTNTMRAVGYINLKIKK